MPEAQIYNKIPTWLQEDYAALLQQTGLKQEEGGDCTALLLSDDDKLEACGTLSGKIFKQIAVSPNTEGGGACAKVITALMREAMVRGITNPFLYTKPKNTALFTSLGFNLLAKTTDMAVMEHERNGLKKFLEKLPVCDGAVVCHCNPFTKGHLHLMEYAASRCDELIVFILSEDNPMFSAKDRLMLVKEGTAHIQNIHVVGGGEYVISKSTFPSYFLKGDPENAKCELELTIFGRRIAPALGIKHRFVGEEPFSPLTAQYNKKMLEILPPLGIEVTVIPRIDEISASKVRALINENRLEEIRPMVPDVTYEYCKRHFG